jgi:hypothetical protein
VWPFWEVINRNGEVLKFESSKVLKLRKVHLFSYIARLQEGAAKRPHGGEEHERAREKRGRETSLARNTGSRLWAGVLYSGTAQRRLLRTRSPMAPQDTPERGAKAPRHRRPTRHSGDPAGVSKHPPSGNGVGFADARLGLNMYPPYPRFRRKFRTVCRTATDAYPPDHPAAVKPRKTKFIEEN